MRSPSSPSSIGIGVQPREAEMVSSPLMSWIKSHQVFIQAFLVWAILCLPGNIFTFILYHQVNLVSTHNNSSELMGLVSLIKLMYTLQTTVDSRSNGLVLYSGKIEQINHIRGL